MELILNQDGEPPSITIPWDMIEQAFERTLGFVGWAGKPGECSYTILDDPSMRALNLQYRSIDSATDVLTFAFLEDSEHQTDLGYTFLGDIFVSWQTVMNHAALHGVDFITELLWVSVHGFLHLFGYDHGEPEEATKMRSAEKEILSLWTTSSLLNQDGELSS